MNVTLQPALPFAADTPTPATKKPQVLPAFKPKPSSRDEILAAHAITRRLCAYHDRLTTADQRYLSSWRAYLCRTGFNARIGQHRLALLQRVLARYEQTQPKEINHEHSTSLPRRARRKAA